MKIYVAGKITGLENYKELFSKVAEQLESEGHSVMNPAVLPSGFTQDNYMAICYTMIDVCEAVYFLENWVDSKEAKMEFEYAVLTNKWIKYQDKYSPKY